MIVFFALLEPCISLSLQLPYLEKTYYTILSSIRMNLYKARLQIVLSKWFDELLKQ